MGGFPDKDRAALGNRTGLSRRAKAMVGLIGAAVVVALIASVGWLLASGGSPGRPQARPPKAAPAPRAVAKPSGPPGSETVATVIKSSPAYASPGHLDKAGTTVSASWYGRSSVLPVIATAPGWIHVRLAQRPDGSTAWLPDSDVKLSSTPYRIVVNTATTHLSLYDKGKLVLSAPAGVGATDDPTPPGEYFVAFDEQPPQPNPGYGPFIMVTSAHSQSISDWEGSGDAIIGIHGPLGMDTQIGAKGAKISHGCIRLHEQALQKLTKVSPGTPIDVVAKRAANAW